MTAVTGQVHSEIAASIPCTAPASRTDGASLMTYGFNTNGDKQCADKDDL
jgi:hypothetical protein